MGSLFKLKYIISSMSRMTEKSWWMLWVDPQWESRDCYQSIHHKRKWIIKEIERGLPWRQKNNFSKSIKHGPTGSIDASLGACSLISKFSAASTSTTTSSTTSKTSSRKASTSSMSCSLIGTKMPRMTNLALGWRWVWVARTAKVIFETVQRHLGLP